ncbi:MAG: amidohydrolase, partial [Myxococcales bacterium]|nr:amidohydrolase [Myxococcales bacterium]
MALSRRRLLAALALAASPACTRDRGARRDPLPAPGPAADTVVRGPIVTNDSTMARAGALAVVDGVIVDRSVDPKGLDHLIGAATRVLDLGPACALPGLTDAHAHLIGLGQSREVVDLRGAASIEEVVARLR